MVSPKLCTYLCWLGVNGSPTTQGFMGGLVGVGLVGGVGCAGGWVVRGCRRVSNFCMGS
jgi:hypothetical protein